MVADMQVQRSARDNHRGYDIQNGRRRRFPTLYVPSHPLERHYKTTSRKRVSAWDNPLLDLRANRNVF